MIKVIRTVFISESKPAGEVFLFDSGSDEEDCDNVGGFFFGKDLNSYLIVKNGYEVKNILHCEVSEIIKKLKRNK